ncbi:MAG: hypothetical protein VYE04_03670 [Pseudomonadota bacterium]|nr:hypothetical protein [Pseudomonadota bacterium]
MVHTGKAFAHHRTGVGLILAGDLGDSDIAPFGGEFCMINRAPWKITGGEFSMW